jgi:hypothetical protein
MKTTSSSITFAGPKFTLVFVLLKKYLSEISLLGPLFFAPTTTGGSSAETRRHVITSRPPPS